MTILIIIGWLIMSYIGYKSNKRWMIAERRSPLKQNHWTHYDMLGSLAISIIAWYIVLIWLLWTKLENWVDGWEWLRKPSKF